MRQKILDACVEAFGAGGFHGATMKEIAERAGISQTGLLHHFDSKAELLVEVLAAHERETAAIVREADDLDILRTQLRVVHANEARPGLIQLHSVISSEATTDGHPAHELYRARYHSLRLHLTRIFAELRGRGRLKVDTRPEILANLLIAVIDGLQIQWLYNPRGGRVNRHRDLPRGGCRRGQRSSVRLKMSVSVHLTPQKRIPFRD